MSGRELAHAPARAARASVWTHRLALVTAGATLLLIVAGGLVTNTGAALAVPDWPTTFGHNMFLFPWSGMVGGVFFEHSHRLLGALVGFLTLGLGVALWLTERRTWLRALGAVVVALVCVQGLLGGLRVIGRSDILAIVHGCLAQAFFAVVVVLAVLTAPAWRRGTASMPGVEARRLSWLSLLGTTLVWLQIVLGALTTHAGWIALHLAGAMAAILAVGLLIVRVLGRHADRGELARSARALGALLWVQLILGLGAYVARFTGLALPGGALTGLAFPVAHRVTGALLLGAMVTLTLHCWRVRLESASRTRGVVDTGVVSGRVPA